MKASPGLKKLLDQQWKEADANLKRRLSKWQLLYYQWRGLFAGQDDQADNTGAAFEGLLTDGAYYERSAPRANAPVYIKRTMRNCKTYSGFLHEAYINPPQPFEFTLPRVWRTVPSPEEYQIKKRQMLGASEMVLQEYKRAGSAAHRMAFVGLPIFGTGVTSCAEANDDMPFPRGEIENVPLWYWRPDPFASTAKKQRYQFRELPGVSVNMAIDRWQESIKAIKDAAGEKNISTSHLGDSTTAEGGLKVRVQEWWFRADLQAVEAHLSEQDVQDAGHGHQLYRAHVLMSGDDIGEEILDLYPCPFGHGEIPYQEYGILKSPTEQGPYFIGVADIDESNQVLTNTFWNQMLRAFGFETQLGGLADASMRGDLEQAINEGIDPGEWLWVNFHGKNPRETFFPLAELYGSTVQSRLELLRQIDANSSRETGVTDQVGGMTAKTFSNTGMEANLLAQQGARSFQLDAQTLDDGYRRSLLLYASTTADALKRAYANDGFIPWYVDEAGEFTPIDPRCFDEAWELKVNAGAAFIGDQQKATVLIQLAQAAGGAGDMQTARAALRKVAAINHLDPDDAGPQIPQQQQQPPMGRPGQQQPMGSATPPEVQPVQRPALV